MLSAGSNATLADGVTTLGVLAYTRRSVPPPPALQAHCSLVTTSVSDNISTREGWCPCERNVTHHYMTIVTMSRYYTLSVLVFVAACVGDAAGSASGLEPERACAARRVPGESVVCVCNVTYCDTLRPARPAPRAFLAYTSSKKGLRFHKFSGSLQPCRNDSCAATLVVDGGTRLQAVEGFGGAVTDAAGINWKKLPPELQAHLVQSYFSSGGLDYSVARVPVGGSDFSTRPYAYNELPVDDAALSNYTLAFEDIHYKLPLLRLAQQARSGRAALHVVGTVWSPPPWMKTNNQYSGYSRLRPQYFQTYADYYLKFIERYTAAGVPVWGITTTNEPTNGVVPLNYFNSLGWSAETMGKWIAENLGPTLRNSSFSHVKIIAGDDQRAMLPYWINRMLELVPAAREYIDGVGVHFYTDFLAPPALLQHVMRALPGKFLLATEACEGSFPWQRPKVRLGSWERALNYVHDIITDLTHGAVGWLDWNLCLDARGGPNWANNLVDSPIIVVPEKGVFLKEPMFYAMGHFSKWIPRRSLRVLTRAGAGSARGAGAGSARGAGAGSARGAGAEVPEHVAFLTPRDTIVVVFYNKGGARTVRVRLGSQLAAVPAPADSITTLELPYSPH